MLKFLIDEDMPRSTANVLRNMGFEVLDVRDVGLRGSSDDEIFSFAQEEGAIILTGDLGFGNFIRFPPGTYHGIVVLRFPNKMSNQKINHQIQKALKKLDEKDFGNNLILLEPGRIRIKRHQTD